MISELGYRAWRLEQIDLDREPSCPEARVVPADLGACDEGPFSLFNVLAAPRGWRVAVVAYHGRTATWCCGCTVGIAGPGPCAHVAAVAYWTERQRLKAGYLKLSPLELIERWGWMAWRIRRIRGGLGPEPRGWRLDAAALFDALVERGLATRPVEDCDPVYELIEQLEAVAA